jgi:hypothetical protein
MNGKTNVFNHFRKYLKALSAFLIVAFVIFFVIASVCALFGHPIWSWMNVLRFFLGGAICIMLVFYFVIIRGMLSGRRLVRKRTNFPD